MTENAANDVTYIQQLISNFKHHIYICDPL